LRGQYDVYKWSDARTMRVVHDWLERDDHFDSLAHGSVVDVEFILGERPARKMYVAGTIKEPWGPGMNRRGGGHVYRRSNMLAPGSDVQPREPAPG
jgi:hypothetical protein